jgi:O-methyltransferase
MNNFFIAEPPYAAPENRFLIKLVNRGISLLRPGYRIASPPNPVVDMNTVEQRINYFHLLDSVIANDIAGEVVEFGCFTGQCALLFQKVLQLHDFPKTLHLYDSFDVQFTVQGSVEDVLKASFQAAGLPLPVRHKGYFEATVPQQLPEQVAFVHIDCGFGGDPLAHKAIVLHCLEAVYPRMSKGAVCVLMDYHDAASPASDYDVNPGVRLACDEFLASKPERIVSLYGRQYLHAFFRKTS